MRTTQRAFSIFSLAMLAVLLVTLFLPCPAPGAAQNLARVPAGERLPRFIDDEGLLTQSQARTLTDKLDEISERHQLDIVVAVVHTLESDAIKDRGGPQYALDFFEQYGFGFGDDLDGIILLLATEDRVFGCGTAGYGSEILTDTGYEHLEKLFLTHLNTGDYFEAFMAYADTVDGFVTKAKADTPHAPGTTTLTAADLERVPAGERLLRFIDDEGLLTKQQAHALIAKLDEISERHKFDAVVAVVRSLKTGSIKGREARLYAIDFFEQNGFGFGHDLDGSILLLATEDRDVGFAATGYGLQAFTVAGQEYLRKLYLPHLKEDNYFEAFIAYADAVDDFVTKAKAGAPYAPGNIPLTAEEMEEFRMWSVIISHIVGLIIAFISTLIWKRQLKTVRAENFAQAYIRPGSMALTKQHDSFLYRNVSSTKRDKGESSGGGSGGSFKSSSGRSSSGHSGKY
jgi:uncharacterized protein